MSVRALEKGREVMMQRHTVLQLTRHRAAPARVLMRKWHHLVTWYVPVLPSLDRMQAVDGKRLQQAASQDSGMPILESC